MSFLSKLSKKGCLIKETTLRKSILIMFYKTFKRTAIRCIYHMVSKNMKIFIFCYTCLMKSPQSSWRKKALFPLPCRLRLSNRRRMSRCRPCKRRAVHEAPYPLADEASGILWSMLLPGIPGRTWIRFYTAGDRIFQSGCCLWLLFLPGGFS